MASITAADLRRGVLGEGLCLISCLSFEKRSLVAAKCLAGNGLNSWLCIQNTDIESNIEEYRAQAIRTSAEHSVILQFVDVSKRDPLSLADAMLRTIRSAVAYSKNIVVDITTMTHEMVLVFVAALSELDTATVRITVLYNTAGQYSINEADQKRRWISRGIHGVRSVIGYPGLGAPGAMTTLVALPGFDLERIQRIAEELEPDKIIVGIGKPGLPEHSWLYERNKIVASQLIGTRKGHIFEYEALNCENTVTTMIANLRHLSDNIVLAPFNSKISTLAVGILAQRHLSWQICYAPALIYNTDYSTPSDHFIHVNVRDLRDSVESRDITMRATA